MNQKSIGTFIAALRKASGMTQKQLAEILGVSDKTISHWECDESAPDLSMIPIIADVFSVSCDELLRGEKNRAQTAATEDYSVKSQKHIKALLERFLSKHKRNCVIALAVFLCGIFLSAALYYKGENVSVFLTILFLVISSVITAVSHRDFVLKLNSDEFDEDVLEKFRQKCASATTYTYFFITFILSCVMFVFSNIFYVKGVFVVNYGLLFFILDGVFLIIILVLKRTGVLAKADRTQAEKKLLRLRTATVLFALIFICGGFFTQKTVDNLSERSEPQAIVFNDFASFKEYIETDAPAPDSADDTNYAEEMGLSADKNGYYTVEGNPSMKFKWKNKSAAYFESFYVYDTESENAEESDNERLRFEVYTYEELNKPQKYASLGDTFSMVSYIYYPMIILICALIYFPASSKIKRRNKVK